MMTMWRLIRVSISAAALTSLLAPAGAFDAPALERAKVQSTLPADAGADTRRVVWAGWETPLAAGTRIGQTRSASNCEQAEVREWNELIARRVGAELQQALDDELARTNDSHHPRSDSGAGAGALEVGAVLGEFSQDLCSAGDGRWRGGFTVQVTWKVRPAGSSRWLYQVSTNGAFATTRLSERAPAYALRDAFAVAARNLLADRRFVALLQPRSNAAAVAAARD